MNGLIRKIISSKFFFFLLTAFVILALNLTPTILQARHSPPGRTFTLLHNNTQDYYFYQALMNEGGNGAVLTYDPYTSEPHQPSIIFSYFLWLGKLSKLFNISYALMYHLSRIILGLLLLLTAYYLLHFLKIPNPKIAFLFFVFAAPFMHTATDYTGKLVSVPYMSWWNGVDPIRRAAFLPHHMMGGLLLVISVILIFKFIRKPENKLLIVLILSSAVMSFVHTPSLLILLIALPSSIFTYLIINFITDGIKGLKAAEAAGISLVIYWFLGVLFLAIMVSQTQNGFPWSQYINWEKNLQFPLERELIGALGILLPFSVIGIFSALKSRSFEKIFIACWLVVPFLFIPVAPKLNLSNIRLIQGVPYLPLAILAILGIKTLIDFVLNFTAGDASGGPPIRAAAKTAANEVGVTRGRTRKLILLAILIIFSIFTYPSLSWSLTDQIREYWPIYGNVYLDNRLFDAFSFINLNYPAKTVTLATFYSGNYLPAYTDTVSFIGHFGYTYNEKEKESETQRFFKGEMSEKDAGNFLLSNKIALVFQGPEEKPLYKDHLYPALLKPVYDKEEVTIYKPNL